MLMEHETDPREVLFDEIKGALPEVEILYSQVLVAVYRRPNKTKGGIFLADSTRDEDVYQGKVGLVLKLGKFAFQDTEGVQFQGQRVNVGDWVVFRASDGFPLDIGKTRCRLLQDVAIKGIVTSPDIVW